MPSSGWPSLPVIPSSLRASLVTLLGPAPNVNSILTLARVGSTPDIEKHRLRLIGYRDKVVALINILEGSGLKSPGTNPITSTRRAVLVPTAA
jgi:hypothetical protein